MVGHTLTWLKFIQTSKIMKALQIPKTTRLIWRNVIQFEYVDVFGWFGEINEGSKGLIQPFSKCTGLLLPFSRTEELDGYGLDGFKPVHFQTVWNILDRSPCLQGHASKNAGAQGCSMLRTIMFGQYWCDWAGARAKGLPPAAYSRENGMSDKLNSLLFNPHFLVDSVEAW